VTVWYSNNAPAGDVTSAWYSTRDVAPAWGRSRRLARLEEKIAEFGKKLALARHESILHAREIVLERLREMRAFGLPLLRGFVLVRRQGRVCGESNYYRAMLC
jgi:hypothetical protein